MWEKIHSRASSSPLRTSLAGYSTERKIFPACENVMDRTMFAIAFDMVSSDLRKNYGEPYNNAYFEIRLDFTPVVK